MDPLLELGYVLGADVEVTAVTSELVAKEFDTLGGADTALLLPFHPPDRLRGQQPTRKRLPHIGGLFVAWQVLVRRVWVARMVQTQHLRTSSQASFPRFVTEAAVAFTSYCCFHGTFIWYTDSY